MHYENENMDELFRRAAENYPLDTSSKDWNKLLQAMQDKSVQVIATEKNNKGRFLWLLLLIPMGFVGYKYLLQGHSDNTNITSTGKAVNPASTTSQGKEQKKSGNTNFTFTDQQKSGETVDVSKTQPSVSDNKQDRSKYFKDANSKSTVTAVRGSEKSSNRKGKAKQKDTDAGLNPFASDDAIARNDAIGDSSLLTGFIEKNSTVITHQPVSPSSQTIVNPNQIKAVDNRGRNRKVYAGIIAGLDATTIKFQKLENLGYDYGVLLGYQLNKKWSIETGLFFEKKIYYTDGKYFNTSKVWMPPNSKITEVEGDCQMFELPLAVKYNFSSSSKHSWFATTGVSSFFMREEDYSSTYYYANSGNSAVHYKQYKNHSSNLFSSLHFSGGYIHSIGKMTDLRIEPYIKLPISGMGIGKLPFSSVGLHVGITGKMF